MGIYIPNMEMPKEEELLCIRIYPNGKVSIDMDLACKQVATAVQISPHGRLIDADALTYNIGDVPYKGSVRRVLLSAPTIIPAEEGEA